LRKKVAGAMIFFKKKSDGMVLKWDKKKHPGVSSDDTGDAVEPKRGGERA